MTTAIKHQTNRHSVRLETYNYAQEGYYFVTVCTNRMQHMLGAVHAGEMELNEVGEIVDAVIKGVEGFFADTEIDVFQIMPNHFHCIIIRRGLIHQTRNTHGNEQNNQAGMMNHAPTKKCDKMRSQDGDWRMMCDERITLGKIVRYVKAKASRLIHKAGITEFEWQRNYYEHVIRDYDDLNAIREYIMCNPGQWERDEYWNERDCNAYCNACDRKDDRS